MTMANNNNSNNDNSGGDNDRVFRHRIVLLFDLDCFYAQCERVRLGLDLDVSLALLQWNSVLAVTYPAREKFGIQRGDSWDAVHTKSNGTCWAIHLQILEKKKQEQQEQQQKEQHRQQLKSPATNKESIPTPVVATPIDDTTTTTSSDVPPESSQPRRQTPQHHSNEMVDSETQDDDNTTSSSTGGSSSSSSNENVKEAFQRIYNLSRIEQLECQKNEPGRRRLQDEGKACLERYRIASARIFSVVLESLTQRLGNQKDQFIMERASIDEFYLDITDYCFGRTPPPPTATTTTTTITATNDTILSASRSSTETVNHKTIRIGEAERDQEDDDGDDEEDGDDDDSSSLLDAALERACIVSHWIRHDVWTILGFTMSAGISTNKMMAKLAASYGKPNGQAVLYPRKFDHVMNETKVSKVRHFGGKLGHQVIQSLLNGNKDATMGQLQSFSLPYMQQTMERQQRGRGSVAQFLFESCRGIDREEVKETRGALVKSITSFKQFTPTCNWNEIETWVDLMAVEVVTRVQNDTARHARYPKTCTLSYMLAVLEPKPLYSSASSARTNRNAPKSFRLIYPSAPTVSSKSTTAAASSSTMTQQQQQQQQQLSTNDTTKNSKTTVEKIKQSLVEQSMDRLTKFLSSLQQDNPKLQYALRGVGLAASNFEARGAPPEGVPSIESFFARKGTTASIKDSVPSSLTRTTPTTDTSSTTIEGKTLIRDQDDAGSLRFSNNRTTLRVTTQHHPTALSTEKTGRSNFFGIPKQTQLSVTAPSAAHPGSSQPITLIGNEGATSQEINSIQNTSQGQHDNMLSAHMSSSIRHEDPRTTQVIGMSCTTNTREDSSSSSFVDRDLELAKKLQASFDREEYVLSRASERRPRTSNKKIRRIDSFFSSRR